MIQIKDKENCCGCSACAQICPRKCITMKADAEGFVYPIVNQEECIDCGLCDKACPLSQVRKQRKPIKQLAAYNTNEEIRKRSSSGGIFTLLSEKIINDNGVVFGAKFNEKWDVVMDFTETIEGLSSFRGSKYVQAFSGNVYRQCEQFLKQNRTVLFSGTPCQIAGLKQFLTHEYDNLLTVDLMCHGVPSPLVWQEYLDAIKQNHQICSIENICFRDKTNGWRNYNFHLKSPQNEDTKDDTLCVKKYITINESFQDNAYMQLFLRNFCLRPSCYNCKMRYCTSGSDLTIGDFWGIESVAPEMDDNKGISAVFLNTPKGINIFDSLSAKFISVTYLDAIKGNPIVEHSVERNPNSDFFWQVFQKKGIIRAMQLVSDTNQTKVKIRLKWKKFKNFLKKR